MEPIPASRKVDDEYGPFSYDDNDLLQSLVEKSARIQRVVPECVGLSLSLLAEGVTFTLVASSVQTALLDAAQYVESGPGPQSIERSRPLAIVDLENASQWPVFGSVASAAGIKSTLSLPLVRQAQSLGGFNLYATASGAFRGHDDKIAEILNVQGGGATEDDDLGFTTHTLALRAPQIMRDETNLAVAVAMLSRWRGLEVDRAEERLRGAAHRAGVALEDMVTALLDVLTDYTPDGGGGPDTA